MAASSNVPAVSSLRREAGGFPRLRGSGDAIWMAIRIVLVIRPTQNECLLSEITRMSRLIGLVAMFVLMTGMSEPARAGAIDCELRFSMSGWSVFYKRSTGTGVVTCDNGQSMNVKISAKGGGLTFGKSSIEDGLGKFTEVYDIDDIIGGYATAEAHAGASKSASARVVTKGPISLALSGKGRGWDVGVAFGNFIISRR